MCILKTNLRIPVENEHGLWKRKQISPQLNHSLQIWETSLFCETSNAQHGWSIAISREWPKQDPQALLLRFRGLLRLS